MKRICSICARKGSSGVPKKNIFKINGKPLIAHSIIQAKTAGIFDEIAVSSDSDEILEIAKAWGATVTIKRPKELSMSISAKLPAIQHCVHQVEYIKNTNYSTIVDLDVTSPLRNVDDIINSVEMLEKSNSPNLITGCSSRRSPYFNLVEKNKSGFVQLSKKTSKKIVCRQDSPLCFDMNASIYIWKRKFFYDIQDILLDKTIIYEMPEERSIDVDSKFDLKIVKFLMENNNEL